MRHIPVFLFLAALPAVPLAAESIPPDGSIPFEQGPLGSRGARLEKEWTKEGGARMYWNTVNNPKELNMRGSKWVDPALVPPLRTGDRVVKAKKRASKTAKPKAAAKPRTVVKKTRKHAARIPPAPLPAQKEIPPLKAGFDDKIGVYNDMPDMAPIRLQ